MFSGGMESGSWVLSAKDWDSVEWHWNKSENGVGFFNFCKGWRELGPVQNPEGHLRKVERFVIPVICLSDKKTRRLQNQRCHRWSCVHLVVTCLPGESYCWWLRSLLCLCALFWVLINPRFSCIKFRLRMAVVWHSGHTGRNKLLHAELKKREPFFFFLSDDASYTHSAVHAWVLCSGPDANWHVLGCLHWKELWKACLKNSVKMCM